MLMVLEVKVCPAMIHKFETNGEKINRVNWLFHI